MINALRVADGDDDGGSPRSCSPRSPSTGGHCPIDKAFALSADLLTGMSRTIAEHAATVKASSSEARRVRAAAAGSA